MSQALLELESASVRFGELIAVNEVSLRVERQTLFGLVGPNGAGKSTLVAALSGGVRLSSGAIFFEGRNITNLPARKIAARGLVRTFQATRAFPDMTVLANVMTGCYLGGRSGLWGAAVTTRRARHEEKHARQVSHSVLAMLGIAELESLYPHELAAGQLRLLEIARALTTRPQCILLDEPAAGLSATETAQLGEVLVRLRAEGLTIVLIEHDFDLVLRLSDHIAVLDFGKLIAEGDSNAIRKSAIVATAYLGRTLEV